MKLQVVSKIIIAGLTVSLSSGCMRSHGLNGAPAGYVSESTCLRLISGQDIRTQNALACGENCCCESKTSAKKISAVLPTQKLPAASTVKTNKVVVTKTVKPKEVVAKADASETNTARASMDVKKTIQNTEKAEKPAVAVAVVKPEQHIKNLQIALNNKGAKLDVDGVMGDRTVRLLKAFQTMNDLPVTGKADAATAKALGIAVDTE